MEEDISFLGALALRNFTKIKSLLCSEEATNPSKMSSYLDFLKCYDLNLETDMEIFDFLAKQDYISILKTEDQETILHVTQSKLIVEYLSQYRNIDLDAEDSQGRTPLMIHLMQANNMDWNSLQICTSLIENGADLNKFSTQYQLSPLHLLVDFDLRYLDERDLFRYILTRTGLNINQPNGDGNTLLHLTASEQMVEILLSSPNININAQNNKGETPLLKMLSTLNFSCARLLINAGADMRIANSDGKSIFDMITRIPLCKGNKQMFLTIMHCFSDQINPRAHELFDYMSDWPPRRYLPIADILELPFDNPRYMLLFPKCSEIEVELVYKKWDLINFRDLVDDLLRYFNESRDLQADSLVIHLWRYLEQLHGSEMTNENYKEFFKNIDFPIFCINNKLPTEKDLEKFLDLYLQYNVAPKFNSDNICNIYETFGYCEALQAMIERTDFSEMRWLTVSSSPFLCSITEYCGRRAKLLWADILKQTDIDRLNFICIQDIARYYTMSKQMISFTNKHFPLHKGDLEKITKKIERPSKLLELSRDSARIMLKSKYNARCPQELVVVLEELEIPPGIQDILMMRIPIYTPFEKSSHNSDLVVNCECECRFCKLSFLRSLMDR